MRADPGEATEVDAEALNSENVYWIDYRKDRHFIGSEFRNGRFKVDCFVHARLCSPGASALLHCFVALHDGRPLDRCACERAPHP